MKLTRKGSAKSEISCHIKNFLCHFNEVNNHKYIISHNVPVVIPTFFFAS